MKKHIILICFVVLNIFSVRGQSFKNILYYENELFAAQLIKCNDTICNIQLVNKKTNAIIRKKTKLILVDGIVPECGLVEDHNNPNDILGYQCDSTYKVVDTSIRLSFALEIYNRNRMNLNIYYSLLNEFPNGDYTLKHIDIFPTNEKNNQRSNKAE